MIQSITKFLIPKEKQMNKHAGYLRNKNISLKTLKFKKLFVFISGILAVNQVAIASAAEYPFPNYPIISQPYINRTMPIMVAFIDNSTTMNTKAKIEGLKRGSKDGTVPTKNWPRRIDIAKNAMYKMADKYYDEFNWGLFVIADQQRNIGWQPFNDNDLGINGSLPIWRLNSAYSWLGGIPESSRASLIKDLGETDKNGGTRDVTTWKYHQDASGKFFGKPMRFDPRSNHSEANKEALLDSIKTVEITAAASYMNDTYPQLLDFELASRKNGKAGSVRDMPSVEDFVEYRCQDIFTIVFADGNRVGDKDVKEAAQKVAHTPPKSNKEKDGDGRFFNGPDFPNQFTSSSGIAVDGRNEGKFENFAEFGKGTYLISDDADTINAWFEDFIENRRPLYQFTAATPGASFLRNNKEGRISASIQTELNRFLSFAQIKYLTEGGAVLPANPEVKYSHTTHLTIAQSAKNPNEWVDLTTSSVSELRNHFNNSSFGIPSSKNINEFATNYIPWLATATEHDSSTGYRNRAIKLKNIPNATDTSETGFRYLGDSLTTNVYMLGSSTNSLGIQDFMIFGSNDGMLKVYGATNDSNHPYKYILGLMPGEIPRDDYPNLRTAMYNRAKGGYGIRDENPHLFGINGGIATRHTNLGQIFAVTTLGQGGRGVFASNIAGNKEVSNSEPVGLSAPRQFWTTSIPLWDSTTSSKLTNKFGYTVGTPIIGIIATSRSSDGKTPNYEDIYYSALVSSGFDNPSEPRKNSLMVIDALGANIGRGKYQTTYPQGELIQQVSTDSPLSNHYGLSAPSLVDLDFDGIADVAYAGDYNGDLYRIDLRAQSPGAWKMIKIF